MYNLKEVVQKIYQDYKEKLMNKHATPGSHHFFKGGLLYHTYCVTQNAFAICKLYPNLEVDVDLIIFGSLLHDIGKTEEYKDFDKSVSDFHNGNSAALLGHSYEGVHIVENYLSAYKISETFKNQALHMIGSHMNEYSEWGALVLPKMLEVIIINFADNIDSHIEPAHKNISMAKKGELYKIENASRPYYKSINENYNRDI